MGEMKRRWEGSQIVILFELLTYYTKHFAIQLMNGLSLQKIDSDCRIYLARFVLSFITER